MKTYVLDAETHYSKEYSLRHMSPPEYILDNRFETIGLAVKEIGQPAFWIEGPDVGKFFASLDPAQTITISHNALFDNCIWAWRYKFVPQLMLCTLGMARTLLDLKSNSLASVAAHFRLPAKGGEIHQAIGMRLADLKKQPEFYRAYRAYALNDANLCEQIFLRMAPSFPREEVYVHDLVLRAAVDPVLHADVPLLDEHLTQLRKRKARLIAECGCDKAALMSTAQFQAALEELGVPIQLKYSPTGRQIPAFAKTDTFMQELMEWQGSRHDDVNYRVQLLASARLAHKSTIEETRAEKFLNIAKLPWNNGGALLPIPLRYGGAHTHRLSGEWGMNMQNLPRSQMRSQLRSALVAPPGHKVIAADLAQIEARIVARLARQDDLLEQFTRGEDVYANFGSQLFGKPISKRANPNERWIAKTGVLGLGYGCGADRFYQMVVGYAHQYGILLDGLFDQNMALKTVNAYRRIFARIPAVWQLLDQHLFNVIMDPNPDQTARLGPVLFRSGRVELPNGLRLRYPVVPDKNLYGAKLLENITQALARIVVMQAALRLARLGYRFVLQAHDELVFVVRNDRVEAAKTDIAFEMVRPVPWLEGLPLAVEIGVGDNYGETK